MLKVKKLLAKKDFHIWTKADQDQITRSTLQKNAERGSSNQSKKMLISDMKTYANIQHTSKGEKYS